MSNTFARFYENLDKAFVVMSKAIKEWSPDEKEKE